MAISRKAKLLTVRGKKLLFAVWSSTWLPAHYWRIHIWGGFTFKGEVLLLGGRKGMILTSHPTLLCTLPLLCSESFGQQCRCLCQSMLSFCLQLEIGLFKSNVANLLAAAAISKPFPFLWVFRTHSTVFCPFPLSQYLENKCLVKLDFWDQAQSMSGL